MSEKTILRIHPNGDFETIDVDFSTGGNYSFSADYIRVPSIFSSKKIENLFIESESEEGYLGENDGYVRIGSGFDVTSGFIAVNTGDLLNVEVSYEGIVNARPWVCLCFYDENKNYVSTAYSRNVLSSGVSGGTYTNITNIPDGVKYIRFTTNLYTHPTTIVSIFISNGNKNVLPYWATESEHPVRFYTQGIVVKGDIIHTKTPAVPELILSEDFNRSELGPDWIVARGGWTIENGMLKATTSNNILLSAKKHRDNVSISADMKRNVSEGLIIRGTDATNILYVQFEYQNLRVKSTKNGTTTTLSSYTLNSATSTFYRTKVEMRGTEIKVFIDDTLRITVNTSEHLGQYTSGFQCWSDSSAVGRFDNLEIRSL